MKLNISSDDINLLVYRYLIENGYSHTAFSFNKEANMNMNPYYGNHADKMPPNALVSFMQKAMIYIYLEYHTDDMTGEQILCDETFSFFRKHNCFRKLGQNHGLPLYYNKENINLDNNNNNKTNNNTTNNNNDSDNNKYDFDLSRSGFSVDEILETNSSMFQLNHPVYVGPPQRRLADKWQLYGYHKLFEYNNSNLNSVCYFNPCYSGYILKNVHNSVSTLYRLNECGRTSVCEILIPHARLVSNEYDVGITTISRWRFDGIVVCSGHENGYLNFWSMDGHILLSFKACNLSITSLSFSGTKSYWNEFQNAAEQPYYVSVGCNDGTILIYKIDISGYKLINQYKQQTCITDLEWKDNNLLSSMDNNGTLTFYNLEKNGKSEFKITINNNNNNIPFMEWDYNGKFLAIVDNSEILKIYKPRDNLEGDLIQLKGHTAQLINACWFSGTNEKLSSRLCTIAMDKQMIIWDISSECSLMSLALDQMPTTVSVCPNDTLIAIGSYGNSIKLYGLPNLTLYCSLYDKTVPTNISWSADRQHLLYNVFNLQRTLIVPLNTLSPQQSD